MIRDTAAGLRYARSWLSGRAEVVTREVELDRGDRSVPATLLLPTRRAGRLPGWILLHGATVPGRSHPQLVRLARAVAHDGAAVLIPEVPEWTALRLAPALTVPTVRAGLAALAAARPGAVRPPGLMGFSFGAPHALTAAAHPELRGRLAGVAAFGGYCDLERAFRFLFTGEHEWVGRRYRGRPDPYGRWIVGANYLTAAPGFEDADDVARALLDLATEAGRRRLPSLDPAYDPVKRALAGRVAPARRALFEAFAPPGDRLPDRAVADAIVAAIVEGVGRADPLMDPTARLAEVALPVHLLHGRSDALIPFTETLRLAERLTAAPGVGVTVTPLFAHTEEDPPLTGARGVVERWRFARGLGAVLRMP